MCRLLICICSGRFRFCGVVFGVDGFGVICMLIVLVCR